MKTIWRNPYTFDKDFLYEKVMNTIKISGDLGPVSLYDFTETQSKADRSCMFPDIVDFFKIAEPSNISFDETIETLIRRILDHAFSLDKKVYLWYSGGIDSTALAVATIKVSTPEERRNIILKANAESIREYPAFYIELSKLFPVEDSSNFSTYFDDVINIDGAYGDTLFGSSVLEGLQSKGYLNRKFHNDPLENINEVIFSVIQDVDVTDWFVEKTMPIVKRFGGKSVYDFFWVQGLCMNYQDLNLIPFIRIADVRNRSKDFLHERFERNLPARVFGTPEFISYSLGYGKDRTEYMRPRECSMQYILDYTKDMDYYKNKGKEFSQGKIYQKSIVSRIYDNFEFDTVTLYRL